jgi:ribosomal protein L11 methyltransferase
MEPLENHLTDTPPSDPSDMLPVWEYATPGPLRERLCGLTLAGRKTATFDLVDEETVHAEPGTRYAMIGSDGSRLAVLEVTEVIPMRFADVPWDLANAEGESFVDVADWAVGHRRFWDSIGFPVDDDTLVQCERFRLIEVLPAAVGARYPVVEVLVPHTDVEFASAELAELDTIGIEEVEFGMATDGTAIPEGHVMLRAGFASDSAAATAECELSQPWKRRFEVLVGNDWLDAWRDSFQPVTVGKIVIWPSWWTEQPDPAVLSTNEQLVIQFDPGRAWGTGGHESTRLALSLLQQLPLTDRSVFDAGCGSGILSVAAAMMGARVVHGVDIDMASPAISHSNAERNGMADRVSATIESVAEVSATQADRFDVIVANILAPVLIELAPSLLALRSPQAPVVLAGLIDTQVERVMNAFHPLVCVLSESDGAWRGLVLND